jgi:hypothetical protein
MYGVGHVHISYKHVHATRKLKLCEYTHARTAQTYAHTWPEPSPWFMKAASVPILAHTHRHKHNTHIHICTNIHTYLARAIALVHEGSVSAHPGSLDGNGLAHLHLAGGGLVLAIVGAHEGTACVCVYVCMYVCVYACTCGSGLVLAIVGAHEGTVYVCVCMYL